VPLDRSGTVTLKQRASGRGGQDGAAA